MIWQGPIDGCADLAHEAALNTEWGTYHRIIAIRALLACGEVRLVRQVADAMLAEPASWPDAIAYGVADDLFPKIITIDELVTLMRRSTEPKRTIGGFDWAARAIAKTIDPASKLAIELRDKLTELVRSGCDPRQEFYKIRSRYGHLVSALAILCDRQLALAFDSSDGLLVRACVTASRCNQSEIGLEQTFSSLKARFREDIDLRSKLFWEQLAFMDELSPTSDDWQRYYYAQYESLLGQLTEADRSWLEAALADQSQPNRRAVALHALIQNWYQNGRPESELESISRLLKKVFWVVETSPRSEQNAD
jgi:hypothetical protein